MPLLHCMELLATSPNGMAFLGAVLALAGADPGRPRKPADGTGCASFRLGGVMVAKVRREREYGAGPVPYWFIR